RWRTRATRRASSDRAARRRAEADGPSFRLQARFEPARHRLERGVCLTDRRLAGRPERKEFAPAPPPLGRRVANPRAQETLVLEAVEGRVDRVDGDVASRPLVNLLADRGAVRSIAEAQDAKQDELLEIAEHRRLPLKPHTPHCGTYGD